ncbi:Protein takeout [Lucilia cuprina]|nr:Protein takeout [Lucilia cuprina]
METKIPTLFLIIVFFLRGAFADLPPEIQKCKSSNNEDCITKSFMKVLELYSYGNAEFGLPNISAITLKELIFAESAADSPVQLNFKFNSVVVGGLEKLKVLRIQGFDKNLTKPLELDILVPQVTIDGDYIMNGKLLLLPLNGKGKGRVDFKNIVFKFKAKIELEQRNNKNFGKIKKLKCWSIEPKKIVFNLQNIGNNNAVLSESINAVINDNWFDLWKELKKNTTKAVEDVITNIISVYKIFAVYGGDLPPEIHKCKSSDNDQCIGKAIEQLYELYPNGNPDFGMPNVAALNLTNIKISRPNSNSAIQVNFEFIKCTVNGLEKAKILRTMGFDKELNKNIELDVFIPNLHLEGDYESTGKLLLLPLNGKGKGDIQLKDCKVEVRVKVVLEKRNGKNYAKIKKIKALIEPEQMLVKLDNIFNGNAVLSDTINDVINQNWKDVWSELQGGINQALEILIINVMSGILTELSTDDFYVD